MGYICSLLIRSSQEKIQPYINAKAEVESLTVVLEMRNDEIHKLHNQVFKFRSRV